MYTESAVSIAQKGGERRHSQRLLFFGARPRSPPLCAICYYIFMTIEERVPLAPFTTFRIGGNARFFVRVRTVQELQEALAFARRQGVPFFVLGSGSNVLIADEGFPGLVIAVLLRGMSFQDCGESVEVIAAAGEPWDAFVAAAVTRGLYGVENLSGIPGMVGATPIQNVGAYGVEVAEVIEWVEAFDAETGAVTVLRKEACSFGYRTSMFKTPAGKRFVITRVCFRLQKQGTLNLSYRDIREFFSGPDAPTPTLAVLRQAVLSIRSRKFPSLAETGTAGSFFKNPTVTRLQLEQLLSQFPGIPHFPLDRGVKIALGALLERLGWKGHRRGSVGVYQAQALVLVNYGGATAAEVHALASAMVHSVFEKTGIVIAPEIIFVGEDFK